MTELDEIKKLAPEERVRRLKEIEQGRKEEIEEAEALIRDSMREIGEISERKHAPIQQVTAADVSQLVTAEEKRMFKTARFESTNDDKTNDQIKEAGETLEEVADEAQINEQQKGGPIYGGDMEKAKVLYKGDMKTTGASADTGQKIYSNPAEEHGVKEVYGSQSVTGQGGPEQIYKRDEEGSISGSYERDKLESNKKRRLEEVY